MFDTRNVFILILMPFLLGLADVSLKDIQTALIEKDYPQVEALARKFISQNPPKGESDTAQYYFGLSLLRLKKYSEAREVFRQLIRYHPDKQLRDLASLGRVDSYYMEEQYAEGLRAAENLLRISPRSELESLIYLKLARGHLKLAQWDTAQKYLKKIIADFPESMERYVAGRLLEEEQYFAVQVGAFLQRESAEQVVEDLKKQDEYAYILETTDKAGRKFYRVRVGKLSRLSEANDLKQKLDGLGYPTEVYP